MKITINRKVKAKLLPLLKRTLGVKGIDHFNDRINVYIRSDYNSQSACIKNTINDIINTYQK